MKRRLKNFKDVELALRPYVPLVKELTGKDTVLDRIKPLMVYLGHPENQLRTIHIAGTSGKTSTSYYIANMLCLAGQNVGLTVSPHIDKISERTQINGQPLDETLFSEYMSKFLEILDKTEIRPSYFEIIYTFSIWLFAKLKVDYAVIETGLGGLYDATNVVEREDKVCVITDIGYDHTNILGHTLEEITAQKVGIVHKNNPLLMYEQSPEIMEVIQKWAKKHQAKVHLTSQKQEAARYAYGSSYDQLPEYQKRNWLLAYFVYRFVAKRDSLPELTDSLLAQSQQIVIPARMDITRVPNHIVVMDGAHNFQKMKAFISSYKQMFPGNKPALMVAFKNDKAYLEVLPDLKDLASEIIVTTFKTSQDLPVVSCPAEDIYNALKDIGANNISIEEDNLKAYKKLINSSSTNLVITGSFYLIAQLRQRIYQ